MAESRATTVWEGALASGNGVASGSSGAFGDLVVSYPTRVERQEGTTSPEELLAAAHASCFCMALAHVLGQHGDLPEQIETTVIIELDPNPESPSLSSRLEVTGSVPGLDQAGFEAVIDEAHALCLISGALRDNVEMTVEAKLSEEPGIL
jgi:osmotically inducible protein OsmC